MIQVLKRNALIIVAVLLMLVALFLPFYSNYPIEVDPKMLDVSEQYLMVEYTYTSKVFYLNLIFCIACVASSFIEKFELSLGLVMFIGALQTIVFLVYSLYRLLHFGGSPFEYQYHVGHMLTWIANLFNLGYGFANIYRIRRTNLGLTGSNEAAE